MRRLTQDHVGQLIIESDDELVAAADDASAAGTIADPLVISSIYVDIAAADPAGSGSGGKIPSF